MRVVAGFAAILLLTGLSAAAQYTPPQTTTSPAGATNSVCFTTPVKPNGHKHGKQKTVTECRNIAVAGPACPLDMRVRQGIGGGMIAVDANGVKRKVFAPRLWLFLTDLRKDMAGQKIVSATVIVHGTSHNARIQLLDAHPGGYNDMSSADLQRTLSVDLADWGEPGVSGDFRLPGFTSASRVDLLWLTYEDGSTWNLSAGESCRVAPDPLMLVER